MRRLPLLFLLAVLGCARSQQPVAKGEAPACDPAHPGIEAGALTIGGPGSSDATATGSFALVARGSCRRLTLPLECRHFGTITGAFDRSYGVVSFELPRSLGVVSQADSAFRDSSVAAAYVVHELSGGYRLDVHVARPVFVHALAVENKIALDLESGGGAIPPLAPRARNVVVMEPRGGGVSYPIHVRGYARTFEANVQAWISATGAVVPGTRVHATAADWMSTWGEFELQIDAGPSGDVELFVGEESAKDGTPIGVRIPLRVEPTSGLAAPSR